MRCDALSRVARREDDLRFRVAAVDVAPLEEFDRQHRDFVDAPHGRRIDADLGEVFAVDTAPLGLEAEQLERRAVECRGGIDRQHLFEGSHSGQRYIFIPDSVSHFGCGSAFLPFRPEAADAPDTSRYRPENPKQRLTERVCRSVSRCRSRVGRPVCASRPALLLGVLGREDHVHLLAVELGHHLHLGELFEVGGEAQQQNLALLLEDDRTAAEEDVSLDLGALFQKVLSVFELEVVVVIVGLGGRNESP